MGTFSDYGKESVINEAYFGKSKDLKDAERILGIYRRKYFSHKYVNSCNADPLLYEFEDMLAEIFGFKSVCIDVSPSMQANAYTYKVSCMLVGKTTKIKKDKNGFRYDGTPTLYIQIYSYLIFNDKFTDGEIMAILLHEVGHNFSARRSMILNVESYAVLASVLFNLILDIVSLRLLKFCKDLFNTTSTGREIAKAIRDYIHSNDAFSYVYSLVKFLIKAPRDILDNIFGLFPSSSILNPDKLLDKFIKRLSKKHVFVVSGFIDERIADNFATIYGYGPETMSVQTKVGKMPMPSVEMIHNIPLLGWIYDIYSIPVRYVLLLADEHPNDMSRVKAQYNYLLAEMDKCNKPKLKKELELEIRRCEEVLDKIDADSKNILSGSVVQDMYNKVALKLRKGDDIREYLANYERDSKAWDKLYDEAEEE